MSLALLVPVAAASLLGSVHCAGMCGGFVAIAGEGASGQSPLARPAQLQRGSPRELRGARRRRGIARARARSRGQRRRALVASRRSSPARS